MLNPKASAYDELRAQSRDDTLKSEGYRLWTRRRYFAAFDSPFVECFFHFAIPLGRRGGFCRADTFFDLKILFPSGLPGCPRYRNDPQSSPFPSGVIINGPRFPSQRRFEYITYRISTGHPTTFRNPPQTPTINTSWQATTFQPLPDLAPLQLSKKADALWGEFVRCLNFTFPNLRSHIFLVKIGDSCQTVIDKLRDECAELNWFYKLHGCGIRHFYTSGFFWGSASNS